MAGMTKLGFKKFLSRVIFFVIAVVAASFVALLIGIRIPILTDITEALGLPTPE